MKNRAGYSPSPNVVVIGIGNEFRRDDAIGILAARGLRSIKDEYVHIHEHVRDGLSLIELWEGTDVAILIDAVSSGSPPGVIFRRDVLTQSIEELPFRHSTHGISLPDAIAYARILGKLPRRMILYGIEGKDFSVGEVLSPEVGRAMPRLVRKITLDLREGRS